MKYLLVSTQSKTYKLSAQDILRIHFKRKERRPPLPHYNFCENQHNPNLKLYHLLRHKTTSKSSQLKGTASFSGKQSNCNDFIFLCFILFHVLSLSSQKLII